jgi:nucleotide-binding universal stress UspA family protein
MRVLISYDGSDSANVALDDLKRAGLPEGTEVMIAMVSDAMLPPSEVYDLSSTAMASRRVTTTVAKLQSEALQELEKAQEVTSRAAERIQTDFPGWQVSVEILGGDPAPVLTGKATDWGADLIVSGSRNRSVVGRFILGSVSQRIVSEADCSVRVTRPAQRQENSPQKLILGIDSSDASNLVLQAVASRNWTPGSEVALVSAMESVGSYSISPDLRLERAQEMHRQAASILEASGLKTSSVIKEGSAKNLLLSEAKNLNADCIFVGSRNIQKALDRFILGSVSSGVVTDAPCSVEIVRQRIKTEA